jgi:hypothetical protein
MRSSAQAYVNIACEHLSPLRTQTFVAQPANMGHDGASIGNSFKHWASYVPKRAFQKENCKAEVNKLIFRADATKRKVPRESCQLNVSKCMCPNDPKCAIPVVKSQARQSNNTTQLNCQRWNLSGERVQDKLAKLQCYDNVVHLSQLELLRLLLLLLNLPRCNFYDEELVLISIWGLLSLSPSSIPSPHGVMLPSTL